MSKTIKEPARHKPDKGSGIKVDGATVVYGNGYVALRDVTFAIPTGTITGLVGVNGSGKSTLFKALMGFMRARRGEISILGQTVSSALRQNLVAYVPQAEDIDWDFPILVEDVVMMGRYGHMGFLRRPKDTDHQAVGRALARVAMGPYRTRQIGELSGGQKKRIFLARALAQDAQVILLDEPFTGVDVKTEEAIVEILQALRDQGRVILVSTHNLGSVPAFCDQTILIKETILAYGPTSKVFTQENLEKAFGGVLRHFVLSGADLHKDADARQVTVITDDERPFVLYDKQKKPQKTPKKTPKKPPQQKPQK